MGTEILTKVIEMETSLKEIIISIQGMMLEILGESASRLDQSQYLIYRSGTNETFKSTFEFDGI